MIRTIPFRGKMNEMERFLDNYKQSSTYMSYKSHLNKFHRVTKTNPDFFYKRKRNYENDVKKFWSVMMDNSEPPLNIRNALSVVKQYLEESDIIISKRIWRNLRNKTKGTEPLTQDRIPTAIDLKKILSYAAAKERAVFLLSSSSGMRIKEILLLKKENIDLNTNTIYIPGIITKSGNPRVSFFTDETKEALLSWLKIREDYLDVAYRKTRNKYKDGKKLFDVNKKNDRFFPFTYSPTRQAWIRLIEKAGHNQKDSLTGSYIDHIYCLRKFMKTRLLNVGIPETKVNMIIGQKNYLGNSYIRFTEEELRQDYLKGCNELLIYETKTDLTDINKQMDEKDNEIKELNERIDSLRLDVIEMQLKLGKEKEK